MNVLTFEPAIPPIGMPIEVGLAVRIVPPATINGDNRVAARDKVLRSPNGMDWVRLVVGNMNINYGKSPLCFRTPDIRREHHPIPHRDFLHVEFKLDIVFWL